jgi:glycogen operon protein
MRIWRGSPYPLGATWDGAGVNVAVFSEHATKVELCLFDAADAKAESERIPLPERTYQVWHGYFPDLRPGQLYGFRVDGPYDPAAGHRFNAHKLLLDPYAKSIGRDLKWDDSLFGYPLGHDDADLAFDERDSAAFAPLATIIDTAFTWGNDQPLRTPWEQTVIYEVHVKGFTKLMPDVPEAIRGTYAGLASEAAIAHLTNLGVTAVELLPIHYHIDDRFLIDRKKVNYWGYNSLGFFAPQPSYFSTPDSDRRLHEFKSMVRGLHQAGIEVILDVVYNHTAEGNQLGPTLSWRGIDNRNYYNLSPEDPRYYMDFTGCGNTPNTRHPRTLQLIMDSLRYWVTEMHIDGFRFDLAATLGRTQLVVDHMSAFFSIIHQDPILSQVKLIAEPWDVGPGGYQVGQFPVLWAEWNGRYRDCVRRFWKGDGGTVSEFATRLTGSSDLYMDDGRKPTASINFITCHDGFCLQDLVSYNDKHNEANGEENRDGGNDNNSWNCGVEGPTDDTAAVKVVTGDKLPTSISEVGPTDDKTIVKVVTGEGLPSSISAAGPSDAQAIVELRERQKRNFLATLFISQGVPMLLAGDEISHTQQGNNNTYCQDSELTWLNWDMTPAKQAMLEFTQRLIKIRRSQPALQRRRFFHGAPIFGTAVKDIYWLDNKFQEMTEEAWNAGFVKALGVVLIGATGEHDYQGKPIVGDSLMLLLNAHWEPIEFQFPKLIGVVTDFERLFDTFMPTAPPGPISMNTSYTLQPRSTALFRWTPVLVEPPIPTDVA